jgi:hypothetical protein
MPERCKAELERSMAVAIEAAPPGRLHPASAELTRPRSPNSTALNEPEFRGEAANALRSLIARVVLTGDEGAPDGLRVELYGDLDEPELRAETMEILRGLIERVVLTPDEAAPDRRRAELHGDLAMILNAASEQSHRRGRAVAAGGSNEKLPRTCVLGSQLSVVAGTRCHLDLLLAG